MTDFNTTMQYLDNNILEAITVRRGCRDDSRRDLDVDRYFPPPAH
jgi:hypothetical protein